MENDVLGREGTTRRIKFGHTPIGVSLARVEALRSCPAFSALRVRAFGLRLETLLLQYTSLSHKLSTFGKAHENRPLTDLSRAQYKNEPDSPDQVLKSTCCVLTG